jgi:hypothetical protein
MKYLLLVFLLFGCSKKDLSVNDCFEIRNQKGLFKVRVVDTNSYMATLSSLRKMNRKYPAEQISVVSKDDDILLTDCMDFRPNSDWYYKFETAIIREYEDNKQFYDKDVKLPKRYKK